MKSGDVILAVDTSTHYASVALYDGVGVQAETTWKSPRRQTVELAPRIVAMLNQNQTKAAGLAGLVIAMGPGSFTGLRVGLALAKGLALSRTIPLVGIPTLDVTAYPIRYYRGTLYPTLQAGRGRVCVAPYRWRRRRWRRSGDLTIMTWEGLAARAEDDAVFCGEIDAQGIEALKSHAEKSTIVPAAQRIRRAGYLAELGWERLMRGERDKPATLQPVYLHTV